MRVLGVDGCKQGWVAVALDDGALRDVRVVETFGELVDDDAALIGVDIPVGEPGGTARAAERAARELLGPRRSSVFTPPLLRLAELGSYDAAKQAALAATGKKISKQAWHLLPKMRDVEPHWRHDPMRVREVHPECSFRTMKGDVLHTQKKTAAGRGERLALLHAHGIDLARGGTGVRGAAPDDVLDAAAVAWSAHRIACGLACSLPDPPERDADGRAVAIWC